MQTIPVELLQILKEDAVKVLHSMPASLDKYIYFAIHAETLKDEY